MTPYGKRGLLIRLLYLAAAFVWWHATGGGRSYRRRTVVLCYHDVRDDQVERFERQMKRIARRAVAVNRLDEAHDSPRAAVCVTFDDALAGVKRNALPILERHAIPATIFAVSGCAGRTPDWPMAEGHPDRHTKTLEPGDWRELDALDLVRIESHSATHADLSRVNAGQLNDELKRSRSDLERGLGRQVTCLALPYGAADRRVVRAARHDGYERIFTLDPCPHDPGHLVDTIGRFSVSPDMWWVEFRLTIDGAYAWLSEWRAMIRGLHRLIWGGPRHRPIAEAIS